MRLYINDIEATLPSDFSLTTINENAYVTKAGSYTYDITLSLLDDANARIFKCINRLNYDFTNSIDNFQARLEINCKTYFSGKVIVLKYDTKNISIQIVSGNSRLNFAMKNATTLSKIKLGDLDLGVYTKPSELTYEEINTPNGEGEFPSDCVFPPYKTGEEQHNKIFFSSEGGFHAVYHNVNPCPLLATIWTKVFEAIGYDCPILGRMRYLFINNPRRTYHYAEMLPDWTVAKFIDEVEKLFNVVVYSDGDSTGLGIGIRPGMSNQFIFKDEEVEDVYENDIDNTDSVNRENFYDADNIAYAFDENFLGNCADVDQKILDTANIYSVTNFSTLAALSQMTRESYYNFDTIFHVTSNDHYYIIDKKYTDFSTTELAGTAYDNVFVEYYFRRIHVFRGLGDKSRTCDIIPAAIKTYGSTDNNSNYLIQYSYIDDFCGTAVDYSSGDVDIIPGVNDWLTDGLKDIERTSKLYIAFMAAPTKARYKDGTLISSGSQYLYPNVFTTGYIDTAYETDMHVSGYTLALTNETLAISTEYDYSDNFTVDLTKKYTFKLYTNRSFDIGSEFIIKNKRFVCEKIESVIDVNDNIERKGYFYPIL